MNITPAQAGFLKALGVVVLVSLCSFLENQANLNGIMNPIIASVIAALAASLESHLKSKSGNTTALFGAVTLK